MKSLLKRFGVVLVALMTVFAFSVPSMAAMKDTTGKTLSADDTAAVTITGLQEGDSVTFYQIVKANYDTTTGSVTYQAVKDSSEKIFNEKDEAIYPSADQIAKLAKDTSGLKSTEAVTATKDGTVSKELAAGEWMALVTAANGTKTIYNPMVLSVYYTNEDGTKINGGKVDANSQYSLNGDTAYAKKSTIPGDKKITGNSKKDPALKDPEAEEPEINGNGDDLAFGDTVNFQIDSMIPSYGPEYTTDTIFYNISDKLDTGLTSNKDIKIYVGGSETPLAEANYKLVKNENNEFEIDFTPSYVQSLAKETDASRAVKVTYSAKLNENADVNFDANDNTMTVNFANNPKEKDGGDTITDKTHQYTFEIDGNINGSQTTKNRKGHELIKVNEKGEPVTEPQWVDEGTEETTIEQGLANAEFKLTQTADRNGKAITGGKEYTATTDSNGYFNGFKGLDAGTYELVETKAPKGYTLNTQKHSVVITANYNEDGTLKDYQIKINDKNTSHYNATYENGEVKTITTTGNPVTTYIKNTKLSSLPSTGSIGTYLFTMIGVAAIALALVMFLNDRRKKKAAK